jgi:hypothetical protein
VWLAMLCAPMALAACFQQIDTGATQGTLNPPVPPPPPPNCVPDEPCTTTFTPDNPIGTLVNGKTDTEGDACAVTIKQAMDVITTSCAGCHAGDSPLSQVDNFDIMDLQGAKTGLAHGQSFEGKELRYLIPGDPDKSLIYYRIEKGSMPLSAQDPRGIAVRKPTLSDVSLLNGWIKFCIGVDPMPGVGADPATVLK